MMKLLLQREISRDQNSTSNSHPPTCNICNKKGHLAKNCFTTKTCFKCNTKGHIAKFCKNDPNVQTCCGQTFEKTNIIHETVNIDNVSRILINTRIAEQNVVMLYDPGSEYSIISRSMYEKLSVKPPLLPVNRCGVGINNSKFQFDGVIYVNLQFTRQDNSVYDLQYEPVLVTSEIKQCIFGLHTELRFEKVERDHKNCQLKIFPPSDEVITVKYFRENAKPLSSACICVAKTTLIQANEIKFVPTRMAGNPNSFKNKAYLIEDGDNNDISLANIHVTSPCKKMHIPVINTTESHYFRERKTHWASNRIRRMHRKHKCHKKI